MQYEGKIGPTGFDKNGSESSSRAVGYYGNGRKGISGPKRSRSAHLSERRTRTMGLIFVCVVAVVIVSAFAMTSADNGSTGQPRVPADVKQIIPPPPGFLIGGYTYDEFGAKLPDCAVTITHVKTGNFTTANSGSLSFYYVQPTWPDMLVGDLIKVTAVKDSMSGENQSAIPSGPNMMIDVTLNVLIPEFPMLIAPIVGMGVIVCGVATLERRREH